MEGQGVEMAQTMYAHINKGIKKKKETELHIFDVNEKMVPLQRNCVSC
jgi:hypothetical protein